MLLTGDRIDVKGTQRTTATVTARLGADARDAQQPVSLIFEISTDGVRWKPLTTVEQKTNGCRSIMN